MLMACLPVERLRGPARACAIEVEVEVGGVEVEVEVGRSRGQKAWTCTKLTVVHLHFQEDTLT